MKDIHREEWEDVENKIRRQWLNSNNNPTLTWDEVKDSVRFGWMFSSDKQTNNSIH